LGHYGRPFLDLPGVCKVKIQREELLKKLFTCRPGIEKNQISLEGMDCFIFKKGRLHTYNGYVSISVPIDYPFECVVSATEFYKIVSSFKGKEIEIEAEDSSLIITCGKAKATIRCMAESIYKQILTITPTEPEWSPLPAGFSDALSKCFIRNMEQNTADKIDGIFIDTNGVFSTDRIVVNHAKLYEHMHHIWLTSKMVAELLKFDSLDGYVLQDSWAIFKSGEVMFSCRKYMDNLYPIDRIKQVIGAQITNKMSGKLNAAFRDAVENCLIFGKEKEGHEFISLEFQNDGVRVFSDTIKGSYSEFVECPVEDWEHLSITVEGKRLKQALKFGTDVSFFIGYVNGDSNAFILHNGDWTELFFILKE
jgi:DNA polymerase III sliding clamp (beta) subunit (PCNA family)